MTAKLFNYVLIDEIVVSTNALHVQGKINIKNQGFVLAGLAQLSMCVQADKLTKYMDRSYKL